MLRVYEGQKAGANGGVKVPPTSGLAPAFSWEERLEKLEARVSQLENEREAGAAKVRKIMDAAKSGNPLAIMQAIREIA